MARSLTISRSTVPAPVREKYLERLRQRRSHYLAANCRFWVFEEVALPGVFVEFTEADTDGALTAAHASAPQQVLDPARIYQEVEF